jgi:hypothetical protein
MRYVVLSTSFIFVIAANAVDRPVLHMHPTSSPPNDPDTPGVISKAFCTHCGSLVPYISASSGRLVIPAGGLEQDPGIRPQDNIYWPDRADWYDAVAQAPRYDTES